MKNFYRAEDVFKDFPKDLKLKIFTAAEGKLVYFSKNKNKKQIKDQGKVLINYAKNKKSYSQIGDEIGVTKVRVFQIVNKERKLFSKERVRCWIDQGLSLREIARLFKKSHEAIRQIVELKKGES